MTQTRVPTTTADGSGPDPDGPEQELRGQRQGLLQLALFVVGGAILSIYTDTLATVTIAVALFAIIMLHEAGHFVMAKVGGMKVTEFFVGFGPRLWSIRRGETEYGIKAIPAGGYVKIIGMHNLDPVADPTDEPRTYRQQSFLKRLGVALAGSTVHFILAIGLLWTVNAIVGVPIPSLTIGSISQTETGLSPAQAAGFQVGDRIVAVDGQRVDDWAEIPPYIRGRANQPIEFVVERGGEQVALTAVPGDLADLRVQNGPAARPGESVGFIGIEAKLVNETMNPLRAVPESIGQFGVGVRETGRALTNIFSPSGVGSYFDNLATGSDRSSGASGDSRFLSPVGFVRVAGQAADQGLFEVLNLLILINIFVGIFNLLPLLPLDGGHVAIAVYEAIRSAIAKRRYHLDVAKLLPVTYLVFALIVFIGISSLYLDIVKPLDNPFQ